MASIPRTKAEVPHAMGIPETNRRSLTARLARIRGQVEGLSRMVEEERYCPDILQQFAAVRSALKSAERVLLASHLEHCVTRGIEAGGEPAERVRGELLDLFSKYMD